LQRNTVVGNINLRYLRDLNLRALYKRT